MKEEAFKADIEGLETKQADARIEVKADAPDGVVAVIKAYVLAFGNVDRVGDVILPGACDKFLASEDADRMAICWQHDRATVIGKITDKGVDDYGLWIEAEILPTTAGKDAAILLKSGAVNQFSIGYRIDKYRYEKRAGYEYEVRVLEEITIYEASPVTVPANPKAVLVDAKAEPEQEEIKTEEENNKPQNNQDMTEELKALQDQIAEVKKTYEEKALEQEKSIENMDKTIQDQEKTIEALRVELKDKTPSDFKSAFRVALEEKKPMLKKAFDEQKNNFSIDIELKTVYDIGTGLINPNGFLGIQVDPAINATPAVANAFIVAIGLRPRTANKLGWIEATAQNGADYVAELAQNTNKSDVAFAEVTRSFAKIAHTMRISTEFEDWFEQLYNYCVNEGVRMIWNKVDAEICNGAGVDVTYPNKVYGLTGAGQRTAFSALGSYQDATDADVLFDAAMQVAKEGFNANVAFVTWATYSGLRGLKDANGNYIFDQARSLLGGLRVYPTSRLSSGEALVMDTNCVEIYAGNGFELEFLRNGAYDAYDVYFRKAVQVKVSTPNKKGVIYIASLATAKAAINVDGPVAALAGTVDSTAGAIKTKAVTA